MNEKRRHFLEDIERYWHCEGRDSESGVDLLAALRHHRHPINEVEFMSFLADAILNSTISVEKYLEITGAEFDDSIGVANDLRTLWILMIGNRELIS